VQLDAPGVTSYGAVWIGFPVLRQCFNDHLGWTQTTNNPCLSDLYALTLDGDGYVLDGETLPFESHTETIKVLQDDGSVEEMELPVRRSVHGPVVAEPKSAADGAATVAMKVAAIDRPGLFEQFWNMGLASNMTEWEDAMRMQQLPIFNTAYADGDGHIAYLLPQTFLLILSPFRSRDICPGAGTSTTPRCRCIRQETTAIGWESCQAIAQT